MSETGPAAALGIPQKNTVAQLPKEFAGQTIEYTALDDATDPTKAVADARKLVAENNIDFLMGSSATPATLAMVDVAAESKTPNAPWRRQRRPSRRSTTSIAGCSRRRRTTRSWPRPSSTT